MNNYGYGYPYFGNNYGYGVPQQAPQFYQPQQVPQQAQPQQVQPRQKYLPLTFVNGLVGAKSHILNPNEKIYLLDSDNPILYVKTADFEGKYTLEAFELRKTNLESVGATESFVSEPLTKTDLKDLEQQVMASMNNLSSLVENALSSLKNAKDGGIE